MKKFIIFLMLFCFVAAGCTGSFNLTKKVYRFHRSQTDKWGDEILFLVCALTPIYGVSMLADAIVFNSIEFWKGENPIDVVQAEPKTKHVKAGADEAAISYNPNEKSLTIVSKTKNGEDKTITLEKAERGVSTKDQAGNVIYTTVMNDNGEVSIYDRDLQLVKTLSPEEVAMIKAKYSK